MRVHPRRLLLPRDLQRVRRNQQSVPCRHDIGCATNGLRGKYVQPLSCTRRHNMTSVLVPTVVESTNRGDRAFDLFSRLLNDRIVFLGTPIDDQVANLIIAQLIHLESDAPGRDIALYINSPGGDMTALFAIYDTMQFLSCEVATICVGQAASAAAVLLAGGAPGKGAPLPNAAVLIPPPHGGAPGQSTELERAVAEMVEMRTRMIGILAGHTGQSIERITADIDRDYILRGEDAVAYGLVDIVINKRQIPVPG